MDPLQNDVAAANHAPVDNPFANNNKNDVNSNNNSNNTSAAAAALSSSAASTPVRGAGRNNKNYNPRTPRNNANNNNNNGGANPGLASPSPNPCIVLKNLDYKISQGELEEVVRRVAGGRKEFVNLSLVDDRVTHQFRGMAFVNFHNTDDAANALKELGKMSINNRKVVAEYRRLRPGEKVFLPLSSSPAAQEKHQRANGGGSNSNSLGRTTFEKDVKTNGVDEHGNHIDKRRAFFSVRDNLKKADLSREKAEKLQRDSEREKQFRKKLLEFHKDPEQIEDIQFDNDLTSYERRMVHLICDEIGLGHMSVLGEDGIRVLKVTKHPDRIKEWAELTIDIRKAANERKDEEKRRRKEEREAAKLAAMNLANGNANSNNNNGGGTPSKKANNNNNADRQGIKWFKPRSAKVADGEEVNESNSIKVPQVQIYVPPRQPLGPDGTIGFQSRRKRLDSEEIEEEKKIGDAAEEGTTTNEIIAAEETKSNMSINDNNSNNNTHINNTRTTSSSKKKSSNKNNKSFKAPQTPLNPSVQPFTPSATFATT